jgi:glutathione S-transferase
MTKLYVILGSHACRAAILMLDHKGVPYETATIPAGLHPVAVRLLGFPGQTVPALRYDGSRVQTNAAIAQFLDELVPERPLLPADPDARRKVEAAEAWGEDELQMACRRLTFAAVLRGPDGLVARGGDGRLGPILYRNDRVRYLFSRMAGRVRFDVNPETERELLAELPAMLDRVDGWIEAGVLGGAEPNAADFVIASDLALLTYRADLRTEVEGRPSGALVDRLLPAR